jgi:hypothetical protein
VKSFAKTAKTDTDKLSKSFEGLAGTIDSQLGGAFGDIIKQIKSIADIGGKSFEFFNNLKDVKIDAKISGEIGAISNQASKAAGNLLNTAVATSNIATAAKGATPSLTKMAAVSGAAAGAVSRVSASTRQFVKDLKAGGTAANAKAQYLKNLTDFAKKMGKAAPSVGNVTTEMSKLSKIVAVIDLNLKALQMTVVGVSAAFVAFTAASLISYFTRTEEGADRLSVKLAYLKGVIDEVLDGLSSVGKDWVDGIIYASDHTYTELIKKGEYLAALNKAIWEGLANASGWTLIKGTIGTLFEDSGKQAAKFEQQLIDLRKLWYGDTVNGAGGNFLKSKELKQAARDLQLQAAETSNIVEKAKLLEDAKQKINESNALELAYLREQARIEEEKFNAHDSNAKDVKALAELKAQLAEKEAQASNEVKELANQIRTANEQNLKNQQQVSLELAKQWDYLKNIKTEVIDIVAELDKIISRREELAKVAKSFAESATLSNYIGGVDIFEEDDDGTIDKLVEQGREITAELERLRDRAVEIGADIVSSFTEALVSGQNLGEGVLSSLSGLLSDIGEKFIKAGIAATAFGKVLIAIKAAAKNPLGLIIGGVALTVAGAALKAAMSKAQDFADGGIVYGETYARVAEYSGAKNNPEVIAPLNRLKSILGETSGDSMGTVKFEISGSSLVGTLNNYNRRVGRL